MNTIAVQYDHVALYMHSARHAFRETSTVYCTSCFFKSCSPIWNRDCSNPSDTVDRDQHVPVMQVSINQYPVKSLIVVQFLSCCWVQSTQHANTTNPGAKNPLSHTGSVLYFQEIPYICRDSMW